MKRVVSTLNPECISELIPRVDSKIVTTEDTAPLPHRYRADYMTDAAYAAYLTEARRRDLARLGASINELLADA